MKRISFKDSGGLHLTQAVLAGRKTMTRRIARQKSRVYTAGEIVAIQQAYREVADYAEMIDATRDTAGWNNKLFVKAELMPHHIRITDVRVEFLQDISDEDCLWEGLQPILDIATKTPHVNGYFFCGSYSTYKSPRAAFAALIDKVSGRGTWDSNPLVWAYSFELVD